MRHKIYCCAFGCLNTDEDPNLSFFTLPQEDKRCRQWLTLISREDLLQNFDQLKKKSYRVCSVHFEDSSIKCIKQLQKNAVPTLFLPKLPDQSQADSSCSTAHSTSAQGKDKVIKLSNLKKCIDVGTQIETIPSTEEHTQTSKSLTENTPRKRKLSNELKDTKLKRRKLNQKITKIEKELEAKNQSITCNNPVDEVCRRFQKLIEWQNKIKNKYKGNRYDTGCKVFALNLHYSSPYSFRSLETVLKLPPKSTLNRLKIRISPKFDDRVLESLALKIKSLPDAAKYCTICIDEMNLKRNLYYDVKTDEIIGFHNVNGRISPEIAHSAFVMMFQGIYFKWKQPLAYALQSSAKHYDEIDLLMNEIITNLSTMGIEVKAVVSDQGSNFDKFAKEVLKVTAEKPYFMYNNSKVYYIFDVPHLIKCIRNNLLANDLIHNGNKISWDYIEQLYKDQKERNLRLIPKITDAHIRPNNLQRIRVKLAIQTLSRTVSAALHTYIDIGKISEEARPTADFIELMNDLFDVLNSSRTKSCNKFQTALRLSMDQEKVLNDAKEIFATTKAINRKTGKNNTEHVKSCVNFQISIQAIQMLYGDQKKHGFSYLLTRRLNQENLDIFFDAIRREVGSCSEPTSIQFQRAFSKLFLCDMLKNSPRANCEMDICEVLLKAEEVMEMTFSVNELPPQKSAVFLGGETDYRMDLPRENALTYVAGYIFFKCVNDHNCSDTKEVLKSVLDLGETNLFTRYNAYNKNLGFYGELKMPPKEFIQYIHKLETSFIENFEHVIQQNPGGELLKLFKKVPPQTPCPCFPVNYLLKLFARFRIFATLKFNNRQFKNDIKGIKKCVEVSHL